MKPFTQTADTLDQELADKIDGILAAHGEDPTQLVGILLDVEAAVERHYIPEAAAYYVAERLGVKPTQVYDVISFYTALHDKPRAKFTLEVCSSAPPGPPGRGSSPSAGGHKGRPYRRAPRAARPWRRRGRRR